MLHDNNWWSKSKIISGWCHIYAIALLRDPSLWYLGKASQRFTRRITSQWLREAYSISSMLALMILRSGTLPSINMFKYNSWLDCWWLDGEWKLVISSHVVCFCQDLPSIFQMEISQINKLSEDYTSHHYFIYLFSRIIRTPTSSIYASHKGEMLWKVRNILLIKFWLKKNISAHGLKCTRLPFNRTKACVERSIYVAVVWQI